MGPRHGPARQAPRPRRAGLVRRRGPRTRLDRQRPHPPHRHQPAPSDRGRPIQLPAQLPAADSELAQQLTRDPYVLDFLDLTQPAAERDLENALVARLQAFLLELGHGFAFVGRQYHFEVDGDDFYIDLLFFNWAQSRFVVIELKIGRFQPEYTGKLGFYVAWVDDENLRNHDRHSPTIGILLCAGRNDNVVRYSLANTTAPLAVADYTYDSLPAHERDAVPTARQLTDLASRALTPPDNPTT